MVGREKEGLDRDSKMRDSSAGLTESATCELECLNVFERGVQDPFCEACDMQDGAARLPGETLALRKVQTAPIGWAGYALPSPLRRSRTSTVTNQWPRAPLRRSSANLERPRVRKSESDAAPGRESPLRGAACGLGSARPRSPFSSKRSVQSLRSTNYDEDSLNTNTSLSCIPTHLVALEKYVSPELDALATQDEIASPASPFNPDDNANEMMQIHAYAPSPLESPLSMSKPSYLLYNQSSDPIDPLDESDTRDMNTLKSVAPALEEFSNSTISANPHPGLRGRRKKSFIESSLASSFGHLATDSEGQ